MQLRLQVCICERTELRNKNAGEILYALHVQIEKGHFSCGGGVAAKRLSPRSSDVELWVQSLPWCRFVRHETLLDFVSLHQGV